MIYLYPKVAWYSYTLGKLTVVIKPSVKYVPEMLDCKTVGFFFSKSVKKSVKRGVRVVRARASHAKTFCLTARAYLNTQKYGLFCSLLKCQSK